MLCDDFRKYLRYTMFMQPSIRHVYRRYILLLCAGVVLLLAALLSLISFGQQRAHVAHALQLQALMVAKQMTPEILASTDASQAVLQTLTLNPLVLLACVQNSDGETVAMVEGRSVDQARPVTCADHFPQGLRSQFVVARTALEGADDASAPLHLSLISKAPSWLPIIRFWGVISLLFGMILALCLLLIGKFLQRIMTRPMRQIALTAKRVTRYGDYSLRVITGSAPLVPKEIELLTDAFNAMLHEIEGRDINLSRKHEELEKSRAQAVAASQAKSHFLANVSHELRTPLNAIIGFSTLLAKQEFGPMGNPKYQEYASDIYDSGKHLLDIINDILDITQAETGSLEITIEALNVARIVEKTLTILASLAHARKVDIYTDIPEKLPKLYADRLRITQILLNLLSNAIKFSHEGGAVIVRAVSEADASGIHHFTLTVEDKGIGMPPDMIATVFSAFNQANAGLTRKYDGAGLGLPLTKKLVELHRGTIAIESTPGQGTTVTLHFTSDPSQF